MPAHVEADAATEPCYVSTGHLPEPDLVMTIVKRAYERTREIPKARTRISIRRSHECQATCSACALSAPAEMCIRPATQIMSSRS